MPVGKGMKTDSFHTHQYHKVENDKLYIYTDGFADQFGGPKGKKFMYKKLNELLKNVSNKPIQDQAIELNSNLKAWQGDLEQVDDILIVGIKV